MQVRSRTWRSTHRRAISGERDGSAGPLIGRRWQYFRTEILTCIAEVHGRPTTHRAALAGSCPAPLAHPSSMACHARGWPGTSCGGRIYTIHSRGAAGAVLTSLREHRCGPTAVLHWFSGSQTQLKSAITLDCWFSVGPAMLRTEKGRARQKRVHYYQSPTSHRCRDEMSISYQLVKLRTPLSRLPRMLLRSYMSAAGQMESSSVLQVSEWVQ